MHIVEQGLEHLAAYGRIPIGFQIVSRLSLKHLATGNFVAEPVPSAWKDYDAVADERPESLPNRFDTTHWTIIAAFEEGNRIGGAIIARDTPDLDMLEGRNDLAIIMDIRVEPAAQGRGVGTGLVREAIGWARRKGCTEVRVETQDTNVAACCFYKAQGFTIHTIDPIGYGPGSDEAKLIWKRDLAQAETP